MPTSNNAKRANSRSTKRTATAAPQPVTVTEAVTEAKKEPVALKLDDSVLLNVRSNVYGGLIYINSRTGDKYEWSEYGDVQQLTAGDLRAMKGSQRSFFQNQWIIIDSIADSGYEDVTRDEIYKALMISQYCDGLVDLEDFDDVFALSPDELRRLIAKMSDGSRLNLLVAANTAIANGTLDSLRTIQTLESCLGCELDKP